MFGVGLPELAVIAMVAAIVVGPDRLPLYARQAARLVRQLRSFALAAQQDLRDELGADYADLKLADLNPRAVIRKHVLDALEDETLEGALQPTRERLAPDQQPPHDCEAT